MNANPRSEPATEQHDEIARALIAHRRLSPDQVAHIRDSARGTNLSFSDAAIRAGLATAQDLEDIVAAAAASHNLELPDEPEEGGEGIVEAALSRQSLSRSLVPSYAGEVKAGRSLSMAHDPDHPRSEQIRALRTAMLMTLDTMRGGKAVALLSPSKGEGRSQLAAELAIAFSQLGRRTLLVDANLRAPKLERLFGAEKYPGLVQALESFKTPQMLTVEKLPNLSLLTAGPPPKNPLEILSDKKFGRLLNDWRRQYDFIFVDTPAVSEYSDALAIATLVGRVLICVRTAATPHRAMKEMLRRLETTQSQILGTVMNDF